MKKLALILVIGAVAFMSSCGPSAKEIEAKRIADSTRVADSMAKVQAAQQKIADSIAKVQAQKKVADSIAHQDSIKKHLIKPAKAAKPAKPAKPAPKKAHKK
jgi:ABC-type Na+ efflux pump permease subunit